MAYLSPGYDNHPDSELGQRYVDGHGCMKYSHRVMRTIDEGNSKKSSIHHNTGMAANFQDQYHGGPNERRSSIVSTGSQARRSSVSSYSSTSQGYSPKLSQPNRDYRESVHRAGGEPSRHSRPPEFPNEMNYEACNYVQGNPPAAVPPMPQNYQHYQGEQDNYRPTGRRQRQNTRLITLAVPAENILENEYAALPNQSSHQVPYTNNSLASTHDANHRQRAARGVEEIEEDTQPKSPTTLITLAVRENDLMGEHASYHQSISGKESERRLKKHGGNCYLTRYSEVQKCYILSVYQKTPTYVVKHFEIVTQNQTYSIKGAGRQFNSIDELLQHYERNRLDPALMTIGECYTQENYQQRRECILL